jgi:DNA-binding transcriptional MerR regulator
VVRSTALVITATERNAAGYDVDDLLHSILRARPLGFTLSEIRDLLGLRASTGAPADDVRRRRSMTWRGSCPTSSVSAMG